MPQTTNHEYNVPAKGEPDWGARLNENFEQLEVETPVIDTDEHVTGSDSVPNPPTYDPHDGAVFIAEDTGIVYVGDGSVWTNIGKLVPTTPHHDEFTQTKSGDGSTTAFTIDHSLEATPASVQVTPLSQAAAGEWWVSDMTTTDITVTYASAPPSGSGNLKWNIVVEV